MPTCLYFASWLCNPEASEKIRDLAKGLGVQDQPETSSPRMLARVGYIICGVQCKMKMWSPLGKKQKKRAVNGIKIQNFFPFFHVSLLTCYGVFYLLFNIILRKIRILNY